MAKILVVEDEPDIQQLIQLTVEHKGHTTVTADNGEVAVEVALKERPDLIIMDVNLPRLDGYEACRRIRAQAVLAKTPVVFLSVRGADREIRAGFSAGATEYLVKPFAPDVLLKTLTSILERPKEEQALRPAPGASPAAAPAQPPAQPASAEAAKAIPAAESQAAAAAPALPALPPDTPANAPSSVEPPGTGESGS